VTLVLDADHSRLPVTRKAAVPMTLLLQRMLYPRHLDERF